MCYRSGDVAVPKMLMAAAATAANKVSGDSEGTKDLVFMLGNELMMPYAGDILLSHTLEIRMIYEPMSPQVNSI